MDILLTSPCTGVQQPFVGSSNDAERAVKHKNPDSSNVIVLDREGNIVQEQSETKRCRLLEANKVNIPQYSQTKQTSYLYPKDYATEPGTTCSDESTMVSSSIHAFFKQTWHLTQQTLETTKVATARTSDPKEPQVQEEVQHVTLAAKPQGNTLWPLPLPH